jgi:hypothetical protein
MNAELDALIGLLAGPIGVRLTGAARTTARPGDSARRIPRVWRAPDVSARSTYQPSEIN